MPDRIPTTPPANWVYSYLIVRDALSLINACYTGPIFKKLTMMVCQLLKACLVLLMVCFMSLSTGTGETKIMRHLVGNVT